VERVVAIILIICLNSCQKDEYFGPVYPSNSDEVSITPGNLIYIGCEGNFQFNNASLSVFNLEDETIQNDIYKRTNNKQLGDVLQSIIHHGDSLFLVINNSGLIRILNDSTFEELAIIEGFNSPRHMLMLNDKKALVSDFGGGALSVVDLVSNSITNQIQAPEWTERMVLIDDMIYISNMKDSSILIIDALSFEKIDEIQLSIEPSYLFSLDHKLVIAGNAKKGAKLISFVKSGALETLAEFNNRISGSALYDSVGYFLLNNTVKMINLRSQNEGQFSHTAQTPYSLYVDESGIYISDVIDFLSRGKVLRYDASSQLIQELETGLIPQVILR